MGYKDVKWVHLTLGREGHPALYIGFHNIWRISYLASMEFAR